MSSDMEEYYRQESLKKEDYKTCGQFAIAYALFQLVKVLKKGDTFSEQSFRK